MITLLTKEAISSTRNKVVRCLRPSNRIIDNNLPEKYIRHAPLNVHSLYYHTCPSLWSFRKKVEHFLDEVLKLEEGASKQYILYSARRSGNQVKIKALPRRIKSIRTLHNLDMLVSRAYKNTSPESKLCTAIMDITFLRCLFSLGSDWTDSYSDLSKALLPEVDVRVRIGNYNLLYDKIDKEWTLWMKSSITKLTV